MTLPSAEAEQQQNTESHAVTVPRFNAKLAVLRGVVKSQVGGEGGDRGGRTASASLWHQMLRAPYKNGRRG